MKNWSISRERYLSENLSDRLGEIAANLAHISSFCHNDLNCDSAVSLIEESKFFIEWTAMDAGIDLAAELVDLQVQLARWHLGWQDIGVDQARKSQVATLAKVWANRVLEMAELLSKPITPHRAI